MQHLKKKEIKDLEWDKIDKDQQEQNFLMNQISNDSNSNNKGDTLKSKMFDKINSVEILDNQLLQIV